MNVRVSAPTRLHFGLLAVPTGGLSQDSSLQPLRPYGGLGLMIDQPRIFVEAVPANEWQISGSLAARVERFRVELPLRSPLSLHAEGPPEHVGLGVGTSLGMALAEVWSRFEGHADRSAHDLARLSGRGRRSGIGVHGFRHGGLVIDPGKDDGGAVSICETRCFPWPVIVLRPKTTAPVWFGDTEQRVFIRQRPVDRVIANRDRLFDLLHRSLLPALTANDFDTFSSSLGLYNRIAGEPFHEEQGGAYSSLEVAKVIEELKKRGHHGVGQSSWGPTVFAIVRSREEGEVLMGQLNHAEFDSIAMTSSAGPACVEQDKESP